MPRSLLQLISIFLVGIAGGIFGAQILWPLFIERPLFYKYRLSQNPTYVTEVKEITVQENVALQDAIDRVRKTVVVVESVSSEGQVSRGSGFILTSDGFVVTVNELLPQGGKFAFFVDGEKVSYQVLKRDPQANLVLIKLDKSGLTTVRFADFDGLRIGQHIFLAGAELMPEEGVMNFIVNEGIIRNKNRQKIETTIFESSTVRGAPVFDIDGNLIGLSVLDRSGRVSVIPAPTIKFFAGF